MTDETPSHNPNIIDHIPSQEELEQARIGREMPLSRAAVNAVLEGSTETPQELSAKYPIQRKTSLDVPLYPVDPVPNSEPFVEDEVSRTQTPEQMRDLREQVMREEQESQLSKSPQPEQRNENQIAVLDAQLEQLKSGLPEEDALNMWRYASNSLNKRDAQLKGDGQASIDFGQMAGQALSAMSEEARGRADQYLNVMTQRSNLLR